MAKSALSTATPSDSAFSRSLDGFRRRLSAEDLENFELTSFESLELAIKDIQRDQAQRRVLRNLNKIKPFLRFLQDYARVIEQFVSAKPDFLAFIWGPIKLCLQIASRLNEAFDALLDAYARIGEALPIFSTIDLLFASHRHGHIQQILADVYEDILTFHKRAIVFFKQPAWKIAFGTTFHSFGDNFRDVAKNLERSKELLVQSASVSNFQEAQDARLRMIQDSQAQREHERLEQTMTTVNWLSSVSWSDQHERIQEKRRPFPGTTRWVFNTTPFCDWLRNDETCDPIFWLYGIPGAGKTFLFNSTVDGVNDRLPWVQFMYFYCKYDDPARRTLNGIVRSLLTQILARNPACLHYLYDKALSSGEPTLTSTRLCTHILTKLAEHHDRLVIGIDGLDECEELEKRSTLAMINSIVKATRATRNVRFFLTSRKERMIEKSLRSAIALEMRPHHLQNDIKSYVRVRTAELGEIYSMDAERQQWITTEVSHRAHGMFLLARLVMDNLMDQDCEEALEEEVNNEVLPQGIDEAYGRILVRMQKKDQPSKTWDRAKLALDLIVMATGPVRTHDIQGALSICTQDESVKFEQRRSVKPLEELLGPIVEVHPDESVTLVHPTAREFLVQHHSNYFIIPSTANFRLATLCTTYLNFSCFSPFLDGLGIKNFVERADYAFQEYATFSWVHHLGFFESHGLDLSSDGTSSLRESLALLRQRRWEDQAESGLSSDKEGTEAESINILEELNAWRSVYERVEILHSGDGLQKPMPYLLRRLLEVRLVLEKLSSQASKESPMLTEAYGRSLYKCPITRCTRFFSGFTTRRQRDQHLKGHERNHKCFEKGCDYSELGFASEGDLSRHVQLCHSTLSDEFIFPNVRPISISKALNDAIDRDEPSAIRDICDAQTVHTIGETGFLLRAVKKKSFNAAMVVMELLGTTSEVGHQDKKGRTALHEAVVGVEFKTLLQEILQMNVDFQTKDDRGETPLSRALLGGHFHAVRILLSIDEIDLNSCSETYNAFKAGVLLAAAAGQDDIIQSIFAVSVANVPVGELSNWVRAALNSAAFHNHESTVALILKLCQGLGVEKHYRGMLKKELRHGLKTMTKHLLERSVGSSPHINAKGGTSNNELGPAASRGDTGKVMSFLREGAHVNYGLKSLPTALAAASSSNQLSMMQLLLDEGAKVDAIGGKWGRPLGAASSEGQIAAIQLLLENGANADYGIYPASHKGQNAVIELLLENGASINAHGDLGDALNAACVRGHDATVELLLTNRAGVYARGEIADIEFGETWTKEQEDYVINQPRFNGRAKGLYNAMCGACFGGYRYIVQLLLEKFEKGAETKGQLLGKYSSALDYACAREMGDLETVQALLRSGADPTYKSMIALRSACSAGNQDIAQLLLEHGANVNGRDRFGTTTLMEAAFYENEDIVRLLCKHGADVNAQSTDNRHGTALLAACDSPRGISVVKLLLQKGADPNKQGLNTTANNDSALSMASQSDQNVDVVWMLLENGANVNIGSGEALKVASRFGSKAIVQLLLNYGATEM